MLGCTVNLCLTFKNPGKLLSKLAVKFYLPINKYESLYFSDPQLHLLSSAFFFYISSNSGRKWYLVVILILISLITNDAEYMFICLLYIYIFSLVTIQIYCLFFIGIYLIIKWFILCLF